MVRALEIIEPIEKKIINKKISYDKKLPNIDKKKKIGILNDEKIKE